MLREHKDVIDRAYTFVSGFLIVATYYFSYWVFIHLIELATPDTYLFGVGVFSLIVMLTMYVRRFNVSERLITPSYIWREIFICYVFGVLGYGFCALLFKFAQLSRLYLLGSMVMSYLVLVAWHMTAYGLYRKARTLQLNYRNVLLVGNKFTLPDFINTIRENKSLGLQIVGVMGLEEDGQREFMDCKFLGSIKDIGKVLSSKVVDYVFFSIYRQNPSAVEKAMLECQERGVQVGWKPDFMHKEMTSSKVDYLQDIPLFVFSFGPRFSPSIIAKRAADIGVSFLLLVFLALPTLCVASLVRLTSKGPALFRQKRMGLNGRRFTLYKFRTMYHDAEERKAEYRLRNEMKGPVFKMKNDPRITPLGRFLRKYSIDELPQLWSVLVGDMSLVGPRPPLPSEVDLYKGWQRRRLSMRPGITCLWQVMGRNKIVDFDEWAKLDLKYIDTWSFWLDLRILIKTIPEVLKGTGL